MPRITRGVGAILVATLAVFVVQIISWWLVGESFDELFGLTRLALRGWIWQPVSYMFLHGRWIPHILFNMLVLYFLGPEVERIMGTARFVLLYVACGIAGGLAWLLMSGQGLCVGASGAMFGLAVAYGMLFLNRRITLLLFFVLPVTITGRMMAIGAGALAVLPILTRETSLTAHTAHFGGALGGFLYTWALKKSWAELYERRSYAAGNPTGWIRGIMGRIRRSRMHVVPDKKRTSPSQAEIDGVLDKLAKSGWESLSANDRDLLERASKTKRGSR